MLDSVKIQDLVDRHTASVSFRLRCRLLAKLTDHYHRSRLAVAASRPAFAKHKTMAMQHCIVGPKMKQDPTRKICRFSCRHNTMCQMLIDDQQEDSATSTS
jgi:hypothetical protein